MSREEIAEEVLLVTASPSACKFTPVPETFGASIFMPHVSAERRDSSTRHWMPLALH
jgi:hypothetical protein